MLVVSNELEFRCEAEVLAGCGEESAYTLSWLIVPMGHFCLAFVCGVSEQCAVLFKDRLKLWRGKKLSLKEAAALLDVDYPTYRKYETGKRTPCKLALAEIERRLVERPTT